MTPQHHPSSDVLTAYAAGALEPGFGLVVGVHLEGCASCRRHVAALEKASGESLSELRPADVSPDALTKVMSRLGKPPASPERFDARPILQRLPLKRRKWVAPGIWAAAVDTPHGPGNRVYVLAVGAGMPTAHHGHSGLEFCTVLQGAYRDEVGLFSAGDFAAADGDLDHRPTVEGDRPCICLFATEGRLQARGLIGQIAFRLADV